jgi:unsaturated rhamnogalacturonyl hydrolase
MGKGLGMDRRSRRTAIATGLLLFHLALPANAALPTEPEIIDTMRLVNDYWIDGHPDPGDNRWARATYFEGNMGLYAVYPDQSYYDYALLWADSNGWELEGGDSTRHADNQCAGQTYIDCINTIRCLTRSHTSKPVSTIW